MAASVGLMPSTPAQAQPDVKDVQAQVDQLYRDAEQASERYNDATLELKRLKKDVGSLRADEKRQSGGLDTARDNLRATLVAQSGSGSLGTVGQLMSAHGTESLLSDLSSMATYNQIQDGLYADYATGKRALDLRHNATQRRVDQVTTVEKQLATEKKTVDDNLAEAKSLLNQLKDAEREKVLASQNAASREGTVSRDSSARVPTDVPASGRAAAAIQYAMAQVGKSYVYGAAGPSSFDCSGLTMMAWQQAGVSLPHSSSAQSAGGRHVASGDLQPGDLVFYYSPISHVGMYIGNGQIVHAANPSTGVQVTGVFSMPYSGAVRPG